MKPCHYLLPFEELLDFELYIRKKPRSFLRCEVVLTLEVEWRLDIASLLLSGSDKCLRTGKHVTRSCSFVNNSGNRRTIERRDEHGSRL
jgi:hypothetical protein